METTQVFWAEKLKKSSYFDGWTTSEVRKYPADVRDSWRVIEDKGGDPVDAFRYVAGLTSFELSRRGIAPRWHGLIGWRGQPGWAGDRNELKAVIQSDSGLYDLVWLHWEFSGDKKVKPKHRAWAGLFEAGVIDEELVWKILGRKASAPEKLRLLGASGWKSAGCLKLIDTETKARVVELSVDIDWVRDWRKGQLRRVKEADKGAIAERYAVSDFAARLVLGEEEPASFRRWTDGARVYRWITGNATDGANFKRTMTAEGIWRDSHSQISRDSHSRHVNLVNIKEKDGANPLETSFPVDGTVSPTRTNTHACSHANERVVWIGIDLGKTGAVAAIVSGPGGQQVEVRDLPILRDEVDGTKLADIIRELAHLGDRAIATVEAQHQRPKDGKATGWILGPIAGVVDGVLATLGIPATKVEPARWKRALKVTKHKLETPSAAKRRAVTLAQTLYPSVDRQTLGLRHDRAEALLLAHYGLLRDGPMTP